MTDWLNLLFAFVFGAILAGAYLSALWVTMQSLRRAVQPGLWLLSSLTLRIGLLLTAFYYLIGEGHWERLLAALTGFMAARTLTLRHMQRTGLLKMSKEEST